MSVRAGGGLPTWTVPFEQLTKGLPQFRPLPADQSRLVSPPIRFSYVGAH